MYRALMDRATLSSRKAPAAQFGYDCLVSESMATQHSPGGSPQAPQVHRFEGAPMQLSASIRYAPPANRQKPGVHVARTQTTVDADELESSVKGATPNPTAMAGALLASTPEVPPELPIGGGPIALPDMILPKAPGLVDDLDPISGTLAYVTSVQQAGTIPQTGPAPPFGGTAWDDFRMTNITVTPPSAPAPAPTRPPSAGARAPSPAPPVPAGPPAYAVTATVNNPITFNVNGGGNTDITSENDPAITHANYPTVVSDLTPDMTGRPPRTQFWASDLCVIHERFHVTERQTFARLGVTDAQSWLNTQSAGSVAEVQALLAQVPNRVIATSEASMTMPGKEDRAYGAGAQAYQNRANAVQAKGAAGQYPGAPPPPPAPAPAPAPAPGGGSGTPTP